MDITLVATLRDIKGNCFELMIIMEWVLIAIGILLVVLGVLGAIVPGLPGPPLSFIALVLLQFTSTPPFSSDFLVIMGTLMVVVSVLDYIIPIYGTKMFGGSKQGVRGSTIGLIVAVFILPMLGIVMGPFGLLGIILGHLSARISGRKWPGKMATPHSKPLSAPLSASWQEPS